MCAVEKVIGCQISFIPLETQDYNKSIKQVLEIIEDSGLEHEIGLMSTVVRGSEGKVFGLLRTISSTMSPVCGFVMDARISNVCGCAG